jgi:hypothetical protein
VKPLELAGYIIETKQGCQFSAFVNRYFRPDGARNRSANASAPLTGASQ